MTSKKIADYLYYVFIAAGLVLGCFLTIAVPFFRVIAFAAFVIWIVAYLIKKGDEKKIDRA